MDDLEKLGLDPTVIDAQANYTYEMNNFFISEENAKKVATDLLGISLGKAANQGIDYLRVLRAYFTTGSCKTADDTFGTVGARKWWVIFKAPDEVMPLLINDPEYRKFALWRMENGPIPEDPTRKQAEIDEAKGARRKPWDKVLKNYRSNTTTAPDANM